MVHSKSRVADVRLVARTTVKDGSFDLQEPRRGSRRRLAGFLQVAQALDGPLILASNQTQAVQLSVTLSAKEHLPGNGFGPICWDLL